jgi:MFS family permease
MQPSQRTVTPLLVGSFLLRTSGGAGTVVLGLFLAHLSLHTGILITTIQVGFLSAAFFAVELALAPFMGALSDRVGRRSFLVVGPLLGLIEVALLPFTPVHFPLPYLLSLELLAGLSSAMTTPVVLSYLADYSAQQLSHRMRVMSLFELATSGGIAAGVVIGGFAWDRFGRFAFILLAALYFFAAICMIVTPRVQQMIERGSLKATALRYWNIIHTPRLFIFIPAWIAISALISIWLGTQLTFILSKPAHNPSQHLMGIMSGPGGGHRLSFVLGAYVLFFGLCLLFWAFFLNRAPRLRLMLTSIAGVFIACIALEGINHHSFTNPFSLAVWFPLLAIGIFAESSFAPAALAYLADISEDAARDRGLLMGLYSVFLGLGQLFGNSLGGIFAHAWGFDGLVYLTAILALIALVFLLILFKLDRTISQPKGESEVGSSEGRTMASVTSTLEPHDRHFVC